MRRPGSPQWVGALLAGGLSRRMGKDKLRMELADGSRLIDRAANALRPHCQHLICLGPDLRLLPQLEAFVALQDAISEQAPAGSGPMAGLTAALEYSQHRVGAKWVLVLAGDLPKIQSGQLAAMVEQAQNSPETAVVPVSENGPEPLIAAYPASFHRAAREYLESGGRSVRRFLQQQRWIALSGTGLGTIPDCTNLNRPEDWESLSDAVDQDS
ncbi:MAG: molybdenum cofactor guanylyltransferase [Planctomycetes bacterium]|nr:molybdenum cofactor guanylyltransferase [Planctomycetota bacterium]